MSQSQSWNASYKTYEDSQPKTSNIEQKYSSFSSCDDQDNRMSSDNNKFKQKIVPVIIDIKPYFFEVNDNNVYKVMNLINKFRQFNPIVISQFTKNLRISQQSKQFLLKKNQPILKTDQGPLVFSNLLNAFYIKSTPQAFQKKYTNYQNRFNKLYNFYFLGVFSFAIWARRANKKVLWWKLTKSSYFLFRSFFAIYACTSIINEFYLAGLRRLCKNNIDIFDAVYQNHLRMIHAHGVDIPNALEIYSQKKQFQQFKDSQQTIIKDDLNSKIQYSYEGPHLKINIKSNQSNNNQQMSSNFQQQSQANFNGDNGYSSFSQETQQINKNFNKQKCY